VDTTQAGTNTELAEAALTASHPMTYNGQWDVWGGSVGGGRGWWRGVGVWGGREVVIRASVFVRFGRPLHGQYVWAGWGVDRFGRMIGSKGSTRPARRTAFDAVLGGVGWAGFVGGGRWRCRVAGVTDRLGALTEGEGSSGGRIRGRRARFCRFRTRPVGGGV